MPLEAGKEQFGIFRIIFGSYLFIHFAMLIPYAPELFSSQGTVPDPSLLATAGYFPNFLFMFDSPVTTQVFTAALTLGALMLALGIGRPLVSLFLWYGWACLFNRNNFIANPGLPMVGWLLLACALIPPGESFSLTRKTDKDWKFPQPVYLGAWLIMSAGYTVSGWHKCGSLSWIYGTAIHELLQNPLARDTFLRDIFLQLPGVTKFMTYSSLAMECLFLPLALFARTRLLVWLGMTGLHFGILAVVDFADLTFGVLMMHAFTFEYRWIYQLAELKAKYLKSARPTP